MDFLPCSSFILVDTSDDFERFEVAVSEIILSVIFTGDGAQTRAALALRGLRVARAARLAKLMRMPLLEELANLISGILVKRKSSPVHQTVF